VPKPTYYLVKAARCSHCGGAGYVQHPAWERYWIEYRKHFGSHGEPNALAEIDFHDAFWRGEGYHHPKDIPAEEEPCPECEGLGALRSEARLEEALRELLPQLLAEAEARERASLEAADAAALLEDLEQGEGYGEVA
jgi:Ribonuclease G/E